MKILKINSLLFSLFCIVALLAIPTRSQTTTLDPSFNPGVSDGAVQVYATAIQQDGKILVGGGFSLANGFERNTLIRLNPDGTLDTTFNMGGVGPSSVVYEIAVQPDNKILIAGTFTTYNGVPTPTGLIRLNANGSLDSTFNVGGTGIMNGTSNGSIHTIALKSDGYFLISGSFTHYNGTAINSVARIKPDGSLDTSFTSLFPSSGVFVEEVDVQEDQQILVSGYFTQYGDQPRNGVARLNPNGTLDPTFVPATNAGEEYYGMTLQKSDNKIKILIGGSRYSAGAAPAAIIKRLNPDGSNDASFTPPALMEGIVEHFAVHPENGSIIVAGQFNTAAMSKVGLLRLEANGKLDSTFQLEPVNNHGYHVVLQPDDNKIIFGGLFIRYGGQTRKHIVRLNSNGTVDSSFNPTLVGWGYAIAMAQQPDDKIVVSGNFQAANGAARVNVARFNSNGVIDSTFIPGVGTFPDQNGSNIINAIALQNSDKKILIGGTFGGYNGIARRGIARLNANGTLDETFNAAFLASASSVTINDILVLPSGKILVAGNAFFNQSSNFLFRLNTDGGLDSTFNQGKFTANGPVRKIVRRADGAIFVVGSFTSYNAIARQRIFKINDDGVLDTSFNSELGANAAINDIALQGDKVLIAGTFTNYGGVSSNRIARLNSDGTLDNSFNIGTGFNGNVESIAVQPGTNRIFVGGRFLNYNGAASNRFAVLNPDGTILSAMVSGFDADPRFFVRKLLVQADGQLLVSGLFNKYNNTLKSGILRLITAATTTSLKISGNVKADDANLSGASVTLSGDGNSVVTTDDNGNYSFGNLAANGNYTISVNKTGNNFPFNNQTFPNLQTDQTADDFNGTQLCVPPADATQGGTGTCQNVTTTPGSANNDPVSVTTANSVNLTFGNVTSPGTTVATEVAPESTGSLPNNYTFLAGEKAYDVRTSATFAGSIEVCFPVTSVDDPAVFSRLVVLHNENGNLIDRTSSRRFDAPRQICASVTSLSPFGIGLLNPPSKASVSGLIAYGTSPANQTQKFVSDVLFTTTGATTTSNSLGTYLLGDLTTGGNYTVTVSKTGNANGISPFDATLILRHIAANGTGQNALDTNQRIAADVNGDGNISPFDATQILRYVAANGSNTNTGLTGNWKFTPESNTYSALNNSLENENYTAILVGDVNGNWMPPGNNNSLAENEDKAAQAKEISEGNARSHKGKTETGGDIVTIPVLLTNGLDEAVSSYSFAVTFDPNVLQPADSTIDLTGTLSNGFQIATDMNTPGRIGIAAATVSEAARAAGNRTLVNLRFRVVGKLSTNSKKAITNLGFADSVFESNKGSKIQMALTTGSF